MTKTAWVFPGQGSQTLNMGSDLQHIPSARQKFEAAAAILGWSVLDICQQDEATLSRTLYTQPCLYVIEAILADLLAEKISLPQLVAGHSLGEYVALYTAGVFDFESGLNVVKKRAELMDGAAGGKMVALMKFNRSELEKALAATDNAVLANDNSEGQVVISGLPTAVDEITSTVKAKRALELDVSGAFHSPLMEQAAQQFESILDTVNFTDAKIPVLSNVEPTPTTDKTQLKQRLVRQMTGSVRWREIMLQLAQSQIERAIEVGPGKVLTGLIKRTCSDMELNSVGTAEQLQQVTQQVSN